MKVPIFGYVKNQIQYMFKEQLTQEDIDKMIQTNSDQKLGIISYFK